MFQNDLIVSIKYLSVKPWSIVIVCITKYLVEPKEYSAEQKFSLFNQILLLKKPNYFVEWAKNYSEYIRI